MNYKTETVALTIEQRNASEDYSYEWLRSLEGFKHLTNEEAMEFIKRSEVLLTLFFEMFIRTVKF